MTSIADGSVNIQTTSQSNLATPCWFGEVVLLMAHFRKHGVLSKISERVRFARRRFGRYDVIDFLAVLFGYAISGERTLEEFYERLQPFAVPFMAWFERDRLPSRSALSRFLAALTEAPVDALRTLFLEDLLSRPLCPTSKRAGCGSSGNVWVVFDIDGTREAVRQRALPQSDELPALCAGWMRCALLATPGANEEIPFGLGQPCSRPIRINGSGRLETAETDGIGRNCVRACRRSRAISPRISFHRRAPCFDSTDNMGPGPCSPM